MRRGGRLWSCRCAALPTHAAALAQSRAWTSWSAWSEVSNAKETLNERRKGGLRVLASRMQTMSKWRNAHPPIVKFLRDTRESFHSGTTAGVSDFKSLIQKKTRPDEFFMGGTSVDAAA